jgi:hypothetical protein
MSKILLKEFLPLCADGMCSVNLLTEAERKLKNDGYMLLSGIIQVANRENGNQRIYLKDTLAREMEKYQKLISENRAYGECDHSDKEIVELQHVSHMLIRYWWDNNNVMGVFKVLKTPAGKILESIIQGGGTIGISSRSLGSLNEVNGKQVVGDDLILIAYDAVSQPSAPGAYLRLQENQQPQQYSYHKAFSKSDRIYRALYDVLGK